MGGWVGWLQHTQGFKVTECTDVHRQ